MSDPITYTTNLGLARPPANRLNWSELANNNFTMIDAAISTFFIVQQFAGIWTNSTPYIVGDTVLDIVSGGLWRANIAHNSAVAPTTFAAERVTNPSYWSAYSSSGVGRGIWTANTSYQQGDFVVNGNQYAVCIVSHVSTSSFATDVLAGKWAVLVDFSLVGTQPLPILGGALDANKFAVSNSLGTGWTTANASTALVLLGGTSVGQAVFIAPSTNAALAGLGGGTAGIKVFLSFTADEARANLDFGAFGIVLSETATASDAVALLGITPGTVATGGTMDWPVAVAPAGYLLCNGAAVSRTTYSGLFALFSTTFGVGDGSTTFNMPNVPGHIVYKADGTSVTMYKIIRV